MTNESYRYSSLRGPSFLVVNLFLTMMAFSFCGKQAQAQALVAGEESDPSKQVQVPFLLPAQPTDITEAMEDFRRFVGRKQWEKAFKHLEKVFSSTSDGLVLTADGIMLPSRMIAREALFELPVPAQDAYRLFFDAEAKKLLDQANGKEERTKLSQIFARYLIASVGDTAADRLGELHFEAGNLDQAVHCWRTILEQRPDSTIPKAKLRTKMAISLARLGHWVEFNEVLKTIEEQHPSEKVTLGGKEVVVLEHLRTLGERGKTPPTVAAAPSQAPMGYQSNISLAPEVEPLWQFRFFQAPDPNSHQQPGLQIQNRGWGWGDSQGVSDWVPPSAVDGKRLYVNFAGYDLGIDLENGKLLWRSGRFYDAPQKSQQGALNPLEQHAVVIGAGHVWSVARDSNNQNQNNNFNNNNQAKFGLTSRELDTGKKVFSSFQASELREYNIRGTPIIEGDRLYVGANKSNQNKELEVLALNSKDGKLIWSTKIGSYTSESHPWMVERTFQPSLLFNNGFIYVDTHSGSLVQLDAASGEVQWGLNYVSEIKHGHRFMFWGYNTNEQFTMGPPQMVNGILYVKGMKSQKLYAVDPQRPRVEWHRPVSRIADLIGVDESRFYLGGEDISAYDLKTRKILWSVKVHVGTTWAHDLLTESRVYHFSSRGVFEIDKVSGQVIRVFRGADLESLGGNLIVTPKVLLTVSNIAVTAYPLTTAQNDNKPETKSAANEPTDRGSATAGLEKK